MLLELRQGPHLLSRRSSTDPWIDVTDVAHRYLFEPIELAPDLSATDLVHLLRADSVLAAVFARWEATAHIVESHPVGYPDAEVAQAFQIAGAANAQTLGAFLDAFVGELSWSGTRATAASIAATLGLVKRSKLLSPDEFLAKLPQKDD